MKPGDRVVVLVPERDEPGVASPPSFAPSRRLRVRAWRRRAALTRELAAGRPPDARPELALVARRLVGTPARRSLADALDRVVREEASRPPAATGSSANGTCSRAHHVDAAPTPGRSSRSWRAG